MNPEPIFVRRGWRLMQIGLDKVWWIRHFIHPFYSPSLANDCTNFQQVWRWTFWCLVWWRMHPLWSWPTRLHTWTNKYLKFSSDSPPLLKTLQLYLFISCRYLVILHFPFLLQLSILSLVWYSAVFSSMLLVCFWGSYPLGPTSF